MEAKDSATVRPSISLRGLGLAALGVLTFSFTFPATELALDGLDPYLIGVGRAALPAVLAAVALSAARRRRPRRRPRGAQWVGLAAAGLGVVFGFPVLSTLALDHGASVSHSAVVIGLLPAATAVYAALRAAERPGAAFWAACAAGALCVTLFALSQGAGRFSPADLLLFGALLAGAMGYAEGGRLARRMPGWQVISWALLLTAPITLPVTGWLLVATDPQWTGRAATGFLYVSAGSMFLGFFAWYAGLARAGIARASQVQLGQPVLTLVWSALFLGERVLPGTWAAAVAVLGCVAWTQRARAGAPSGGEPRRPPRRRTAGEQAETGRRAASDPANGAAGDLADGAASNPAGGAAGRGLSR